MASLLVPISVTAKIVRTKTPVPTLSGPPFNMDGSLEQGIHVHWALPDALTRAKVLGNGTSKQAVIFPGVPDRWLVTRFNPAPAANASSSTRTWRAWIVDSRAKTATPLESWTAPAPSVIGSVHTLPGLLPSAKDVGYPGWGLWDGAQTDFDAAVTSAIYYPSARQRFGFYDDLAGQSNSGSLSYTVIGWYSITANDPLFMSANRQRQIADWLWDDSHGTVRPLMPLVGVEASAVANFKPPVTITREAQPGLALIDRAKMAVEQTAARTLRMQTVQGALGKPTTTQHSGVVFSDPNPTEILCHGSVVDVPLAGSDAAADSIATSQISLYPSIKRALADVTASTDDPQQLDYTEMLLQDLDHQKGTIGGVVDLPGAAQALTFQGVPGAGKYYAQIRISTPQPFLLAEEFVVASATEGMFASGHWPQFAREAVSGTPTTTGPTGVAQTSQQSHGPTLDKDFFSGLVSSWITKVQQAFENTKAAAASSTPIDERMVRVSDTRSNAQPLRLAPSINGSGTDGSGWWIDMKDTDALTQILISTVGTVANVQLPDASDLFYQPGPRWYRPWSPLIVLTEAGRSSRFGEDGRYDQTNNTLRCRSSASLVRAIYTNTGTAVWGSQILANPAGITSVPGLPADTRALLNEALLLDTGSVLFMAATFATGTARSSAEPYLKAAVQGIYLYRLPSLTVEQYEALGKIKVDGDLPSPVAICPWLSDPWDPLFLDSNYSYTYSSIDVDWQLEEDHVEMTPSTGAAEAPPVNQLEVFNDRSRVTATIAKVLESALVTQKSLDPVGNFVRRQTPPNGLTQDAFGTMDMLSAPIVHTQLSKQARLAYGSFDEALFSRGYRQRCGVLSLNKLSLIDVFGTSRQWNAASNTKPPSTTLTPRLPFWSRLQFRLQSAKDPTLAADSQNSAICGLLVPDFVEHSLEVFDESGNGIGQLTCDRARLGGGPNTPAITLNVGFKPYPWVAVAKRMTAASDPLDAIDHPTLRKLVAGVRAQSVDIPQNASVSQWYETGLTAMLRVIDTVRATLDPSLNTPDHKVRLMGEPILVMVARIALETNAATDSATVANGSALAVPPSIPTISVRIGDVTRPDDGVFGIFDPNDSPALSRFAPVSKDAAEKAILNGITTYLPSNRQAGEPVQHRFIRNQANAIALQADRPQDVVLLTDIRGSLHATCGVLPRKKITVPKEFLDASLQNMEPVISVGPIMTVNATNDVKPLIPPPQEMGYDANFVYASPGRVELFPQTALPPSPPLAELPVTRVTLNDGWVRLVKHRA